MDQADRLLTAQELADYLEEAEPGMPSRDEKRGAVNRSTAFSLDITLDITAAVDPPRARRLAALLLGLVARSTLKHSSMGNVGADRRFQLPSASGGTDPR